jgi:hypothetical protein
MSDRIGRDFSRPQLLHSQQAQQTSQPPDGGRCGVHPLVIKIAVGAAVWFVVTSWLAFAWDSEIDYLLAIVTLFFVIFFTLFFLTASFSVHDPRWPVRQTSFREFLKSNIRIGRGTMSGREVFTRDRPDTGRARVRGHSYRSCLGDLRLSALATDLPLRNLPQKSIR